MNRHRITRWAALLLALGTPVFAGGSALYLEHLKPLFEERCYACHGALKQKGGLRLDTAEAIHRGAKNGPVLDLQDPAASEILRRLTTSDLEERMPPEGKPVSEGELARVRAWIAEGATGPENERPEDDPAAHWAFQRIEQPSLPAGDAAHPIDRFIEARHGQLGVSPSARPHTCTRAPSA